MDTIMNILKHHPLKSGEGYCVYRLRPDGWPWGYNGTFDSARDVANAYVMLNAYPDTIGVWITKESGDGTTDVTIFKSFRKKKGGLTV